MIFHKSPGSTSLSRRAFLKVTGGGAAALLLAACAPPTGQPAAESGDSEGEASTDAQISLSFWTPGGSQVYCEGFETIAQNYEEQNPNINIEEAQCGAGEQNFNEVLLARIAAGNPPDATIIWTSPAAFGARNALVELDELMASSQYSQKEAWPAGVLASCLFNGKTYGLPVAAGTYAMYYNAEWFEEKGISSAREDFPKTWDELRALSKEFTVWNGDTLETAGFIPWRDPYYLPIFSALNGTQLYDAENQQYLLNNEGNVEMMEYALSWLDEEYQGDINKVNVSGNWGANVDGEGRPGGFPSGKLAMIVEGFWYMGDFYGNDVQFERWDVAPFPVGPSGSQTVSGYWPNWLVVPRGSRNPEEAFNYLDYMSAEGIQIWFSNIPDLPTNSNVPTDLYPQLTADKRGVEFTQEATDFFRGQLDISTPMWDSPVQDFATDQIMRALEQIYTKTATPANALAEAQQACQTELDNLLQQFA
jgi:ABC-type glycerol-3-phosphate transport system substrate-binding protein